MVCPRRVVATVQSYVLPEGAASPARQEPVSLAVRRTRMTITDVGHVAALSGEKVTSKVDTVAVVGTSANPSGLVRPCDVLLRSNVQVPLTERTPGVQFVGLNAGPAARVPPRVGCQDWVIAHALISAMSAFRFAALASSRNRKNGPAPARCKK